MRRSPLLAAQVPQWQAGTEPGVVSFTHLKGLEVFSKKQDRGYPGTEGVLGWSRRAPKALRWQGQRVQGLLAHRQHGPGQPHSQAGFGSHFGASGPRVREEKIRDFL